MLLKFSYCSPFGGLIKIICNTLLFVKILNRLSRFDILLVSVTVNRREYIICILNFCGWGFCNFSLCVKWPKAKPYTPSDPVTVTFPAKCLWNPFCPVIIKNINGAARQRYAVAQCKQTLSTQHKAMLGAVQTGETGKDQRNIAIQNSPRDVCTNSFVRIECDINVHWKWNCLHHKCFLP